MAQASPYADPDQGPTQPPRKVLVLGSYAPSLYRFRQRLIKDLLASGVAVVGATPDPDADGTLTATLASWGATYRVAPIARTGINPLQDLASLVALVRLVRQERPDAVFCYTVKPVIYGTLAAWLARVPRRVAMITGLGYPFTPGGGWPRYVARVVQLGLYRVALPRAHTVLVQNADDRISLSQYGIARHCRELDVVPGSGLDTTFYTPAPLPKAAHDQPVFLMMARLVRDKGVFEYVAAARQLKAWYPHAVCQLVGRREAHPGALDERALAELRDSGVIQHLPRTEDVRPYFRQCSVYVLPSYREGTPRTVLEAMAMGRPAITTDAPGCRTTVVDGESGWLVPVGDAQALASAMAAFCARPERIAEMGAAARTRAVAVFDVARVNARIGQALGVGRLLDSRALPEHEGATAATDTAATAGGPA